MVLHKKNNDLTLLHNKLLKILSYIHVFCQENKLDYSLAYGSALGAKRHKGFIPWDDDADIYMTWEAYKKFRLLFKEKGDKQKYYLQELGALGQFPGTAKLRMNNTTFIEPLYKNYDMHQGVFVDIFILCDAPDSYIKRLKMQIANQYLTLKGLSNRFYNRRKLFLPLLAFLRLFPKNFLREKAMSVIIKTGKENSNDVFDSELRIFARSFYPRNWIFPTQKVEFGGKKLYIPGQVEKYLEHIYGDYMRIPNEEEIAWTVHAEQWSATEDFRKILSVTNDFKDEK